VPPGVARPELTERSLRSNIAAGSKTCAGGDDALRATVRGKQLRIVINRNALSGKPQGWLWNWTAEAEASGCIMPGQAMSLASRIVESVPLEPRTADRLLRAGASMSFVDIGPATRLEVFTPIMREGAAPGAAAIETVATSGEGGAINVDLKASDQLLGYETAWYGAIPKAEGAGFRLAPLSAQRTIQGKTESAAPSAATYLRFPSESNFYRLFRKADVEGHGIPQMIITAPTRAELERRTKAIDADPSLCAAPDGLCVEIPRRAAVNVSIAVYVNGNEVRLQNSGTVGGAIQTAGERNVSAILPRLVVERPYGGKLAPVEFDHAAGDILSLPLIGGDKISW
jgi:hypothetical protein